MSIERGQRVVPGAVIPAPVSEPPPPPPPPGGYPQPETPERWTPPALEKILGSATEDYNHPSFGLDDLLIMLREAYDAGAAAGRPYVSVDPAMRFGRPCVNNTRLSVEAVAEHVWAGEPTAEVAEEFAVTRPDVIVACWYAGKCGTKAWRRRWGKWADAVHDALWHSLYVGVEDPPDLNGEPGGPS